MADEDYAIVFSGGGALGAWEIGCLKAILFSHKNRAPSIVTGASAGALNAAGVCSNMPPDKLHQLWAGLTPESVCRFRFGLGSVINIGFRAIGALSFTGGINGFLDSQTSLYETTRLYETLRKTFPGSDGDFLKSDISFAISLTGLASRSRKLFYKLPPGKALPPAEDTWMSRAWEEIRSMEMLHQVLMGTTALPILFPPFEGLFDGGVLLNQPISPAIALGAHRIYVLIPTSEALGRTENLLSIGSALITAWLSASLVSQVAATKLRNEIRGAIGDPKFPKIELCVIRPNENIETKLGVGLLSFGEKVDELVSLGEQEAHQRIHRFDPANENTWY